MWPFKKKEPLVNFEDAALTDLAELLRKDQETPGADILNRSVLDFSIPSLQVLDSHIEAMRTRNLKDAELVSFALRCGAYVGEVIRRSAKGTSWHWLRFEEAAKLNPSIASMGQQIGTTAILWRGGSLFCFPVAKVVKRLANGQEDSVKFFAEGILNLKDGT